MVGGQINREVIRSSSSASSAVTKDIRYYYDASGRPVAIRVITPDDSELGYTSVTYYLQTNLQGDVVGIYNDSGTKIYEYAYDAWGNIIKSSQVATGGSNAHAVNPFRYRGYYYDTETGLYYLQSRYYNPEWGRFLNADFAEVISNENTLTDKNLYAYCDNNPIMRVDEDGEFWNIVIGAAVGGIISGTISAISQIIDNEGLDNFSWARVGVAAAGGAISGGLAATGMLVGGQMIANGIIGAVGSGIDTYLGADENTTALDYVSNIAIGAGIGVLGGKIGGNGTGNKHLSASAGRVLKRVGASVKNVTKQGIKNTVKEIGRAGKYYYSQIGKQSFQNGVAAIDPIIMASIPNFFYNVRGVTKYFE